MAKLKRQAWLKLSEAAEMLSKLTGETITFNELLRHAEGGSLTLSFYFIRPLPVSTNSYKVLENPILPKKTWQSLRNAPDYTLRRGGAYDGQSLQISGLWEINASDPAKILFVNGAEANHETEILSKALPKITAYGEDGPRWRYLDLFSFGMNTLKTASIHHQDIPDDTLICVRPEMLDEIIDNVNEPQCPAPRLDDQKEKSYLQIISTLLAKTDLPPAPYKTDQALQLVAPKHGIEVPKRLDTIDSANEPQGLAPRLDNRKEKSYLQIIRTLLAETDLPLAPYKAAQVLQVMAAKHGIEVPKKLDTIADKISLARQLKE